ncbi:hypothetical protein EDI_034420 [Entamoeba dispar SAW760]|uniref:Uncharacterized protein n=1 Tax=Entamoeba dispar (strain ATCC PRA-260 / SAW760) TaxID=370354 RepID=B0EJM4_ENTDS|nr:uncharacterized protein EDI_034420 [Entamoeba dispar SAW760]EDR25269.1 hypothetical protein EDI_034420 [Entamoeba dispar SAW760]|eukprot:EDR25269.1 hypothetical protein EDI_034420 [Entamoeba dispar SAW760]
MTKTYNKDEMNEVKRESKSFEGVQQGVLLALLNSIGFSFEFRRPERFAIKTIQYLVINDVYFNEKKLEFGSVIDEYCDKQYASEIKKDMSSNQIKTIKRRRDLNRAALTFNWLVEYAEQNGYTIHKRSTKSSKKTLQMEKINEISLNGQTIITQTQMNHIGKQMNQYVVSQFVKEEKSSTLPAFHPFSISLLQINQKNKLVPFINPPHQLSFNSNLFNKNFNQSTSELFSLSQNQNSLDIGLVTNPYYNLTFAPVLPPHYYSFVY